MKNIAVRPLVPADRPSWFHLWRGYQTFYKVEISPEVTDLTFARLTGGIEPMEGAVAVLDHEVVGLVHFVTHRSTWTRGDYCYLQDLFTNTAVRRVGVGTALIEYVQRRARELSCSRVYWLTHEANTEAISLYDRVAERSGFVQYRHML
jgi:GNAT superfamily N-acetyltransferase